MLNDLFAEACGAIWGRPWRTQAAAAFGVSPRTIGRWAAGLAEIPPEVWSVLADRIAEHTKALASVAARLPILRS